MISEIEYQNGKAKKKRRKIEGSLESEMEGHGQIRRPFWTKFPASSTGRVGSATRHEGLVGREQKEVLQCNAMQCK